jgi:hypothetical protein
LITAMAFTVPYFRQTELFQSFRCGRTLESPADCFAIALLPSTSLSLSSTKVDILRRELWAATAPGYGRRLMGRLITAAASNAFTCANHGIANNQVVFFAIGGGASMPSGVVAGTGYFVVNATTDTFQVANSQGGTALSISGSFTTGRVVVIPTGAVDAVDRRHESLVDTVRLVGTGGGYLFGGLAIVMGGSPQSPIVVSNFNNASGQVTIASNHNLTNGDEVFFQLDTNAVIPVGLTALQSYFARSVSTTVFTLHPTRADANAGTAAVTFSNAGSGNIYMHYAQGSVHAYETFASVSVNNGSEKAFAITLAAQNSGDTLGAS